MTLNDSRPGIISTHYYENAGEALSAA